MFATGFVIGSVVGTATGLALVVLRQLSVALDAGRTQLQPALVPLQVRPIRPESLI